MAKKFMSAELHSNLYGCFIFDRVVSCDLWPPNIPIPEEPHDWRAAAISNASHEGLVIKEHNLVDVKSYIEWKIRNSVFFENKIILSDVQVEQKLPEGYVVVGTYDGFPLMAYWEKEF